MQCQKEDQDHRIINDCWEVDSKYSKECHSSSNLVRTVIQISQVRLDCRDNNVDMMKLIEVIEDLRQSRCHNTTIHIRMMCRIWENNFWCEQFCFNSTTFKWNRCISEYIYVLNCCEYCTVHRHSEHRLTHYTARNCSLVWRQWRRWRWKDSVWCQGMLWHIQWFSWEWRVSQNELHWMRHNEEDCHCSAHLLRHWHLYFTHHSVSSVHMWLCLDCQ